MSFPAQVFRVLIASPSDVAQEREMAVRAIQEWNDLNAAERQLVLLPLRWETHSAPEYGKRPQETINRQVVDHCDLLVGIFWTRVGSPTGVADSGTIEEIERVATGGKPVMLYFSQAKHDPDKLDLDQLAKLREFKKKTFPKALIESYSDLVEFKEKVSKQIEIQLRTILAERSDIDGGSSAVAPVTDVVLHFADPDDGEDVGKSLVIKTKYLDVKDFDSIPDYLPAGRQRQDAESTDTTSDASFWKRLQAGDSNRNYYRQRVTALVLKEFFKPIRFWLKNQGAIGARDVYIDLSFDGGDGEVILISKSQLPTSQPSPSSSVAGFLAASHPNSPKGLIIEGGNGWSSQMEIRALQPQRQLSPTPELLIGARANSNVKIIAKIFADTLPEPVVRELSIRIEVENISANASEIVDEIIVPTDI